MRGLAILLGVWASLVVGTSYAKTETITLLDKGEPFEGLTFHDGLLWVGKSRKEFNSHYSLEAYKGDTLLGSVTFPHSAAFVYPYSTHSVLVVGTGHTPNLTHYTLVENKNGKLSAKTKVVPVDAWARTWIGSHNGREYFTDPGGNPNDTAMSKDFSLAAQTFFTISPSSRPRYLPVRLRLPLGGIKVGSVFYVYNAESIGDARSNLYQLNPQTNKLTPVFANFQNKISSVIHIASSGLLAMTAEGAGDLLFVDEKTLKEVGRMNVGQSPRSVAAYGKCLIIGNRDERNVVAVNTSNPLAPTVVGELAVDLSVSEFRVMDKVAVDLHSGQIYARSNYACNAFAQACNDDWNRIITFKGDVAQQIASECAP